MLREIIRARMEREGVKIDGFVFKTSREGYTPKAQRAAQRAKMFAPKPRPPHAELDAVEREQVEREVSAIEDVRLREALKRAMTASLEWKKGVEAQNKP